VLSATTGAEGRFTRPAVVVPVPRFYFHIVADTTFLDEEGTNFVDGKAALLHAKQLAAELVRSLNLQDGTIVVENEDDGKLFEVPLSGLSS
jgi:sulfur carrier protein ThiS